MIISCKHFFYCLIAFDQFVGFPAIFYDSPGAGFGGGADVVGRLGRAHRGRDSASQASPRVADRRAEALERRRVAHFPQFPLQTGPGGSQDFARLLARDGENLAGLLSRRLQRR